VSRKDKPLAWFHGEIKTPPFGSAARLEAGYLLRTPAAVIGPCQKRLREYDDASK
jgi:hypothetical protein